MSKDLAHPSESFGMYAPGAAWTPDPMCDAASCLLMPEDPALQPGTYSTPPTVKWRRQGLLAFPEVSASAVKRQFASDKQIVSS